MDIIEAFDVIANISPCGNCEYKNTGCSRLDEHVWNDGFCIKFDEAVGIIKEAVIPSSESSTELEPEPEG